MPPRQARVKTEKPFENLAPGPLSSQTASQGDACVAGFGAIALSQALTATAPSSILLHNRKTHIRQCVDRDEYWPIPGSRESGSPTESPLIRQARKTPRERVAQRRSERPVSDAGWPR